MTKIRHHNRHLDKKEEALLKAWAWEEAHRDKDGLAHRLLRERGIDLGEPLALLHAAALELSNEEICGDRILPKGWPWGEKRLAEIAEDLKMRSAVAEPSHS